MANLTDCVWFVEARESNNTIRLVRDVFSIDEIAETSAVPADHLNIDPALMIARRIFNYFPIINVLM